VTERTPEELEMEAVLKDEPPPLPPALSATRLWHEIEARRRPRSVAVCSSGVLDVRAILRAALAPALGR
jgi:hypothetical protein